MAKKWDEAQLNCYITQLANYAESKLSELNHIQFYSVKNSPIISFNIQNIHHNDIAILLSEQNIAIRTGGLCAKPLMDKLGCHGVIRISIMPYNNQQDIDSFVTALENAIEILT